MARAQKHRITLSYFFFLVGSLCLIAALFIITKGLNGAGQFIFIGALLCLWSSVVLTSNKISAKDINKIILSIRGKPPP